MIKIFSLPNILLSKFRKTRRRNKIIIILLTIVLLVIGWGFFAPKGQSFITKPVARGEIVEVVSESGNVTSSGRVDVYSPSTGVVEEIYVDNDTKVVSGQELFKVKSTATDQEKQAAWANYLAAKNSLDSANAGMYTLQSSMYDAWDSFKNLAENDTYETNDGNPKYENRSSAEFHIAEDNWLAAESKYKNQQTAVAQAQAAVNSTWLLYEATQDMTVKATADGSIANLAVSQGSLVAAKIPTTATRPVLSIATPIKTEVVVSFSETDIVKVKKGQEATIRIDAAGNETFTGKVERVDSIGTNEAGVIRYSVYIEILNAGNKLLTGMSCDVDITTNKVSNVLLVPNSAIKPYQGGKSVRIAGKNGQIVYIPVEIGVKGKENTQILKGLSEGQVIITALPNDQIKRAGLFGN